MESKTNNASHEVLQRQYILGMLVGNLNQRLQCLESSAKLSSYVSFTSQSQSLAHIEEQAQKLYTFLDTYRHSIKHIKQHFFHNTATLGALITHSVFMLDPIHYQSPYGDPVPAPPAPPALTVPAQDVKRPINLYTDRRRKRPRLAVEPPPTEPENLVEAIERSKIPLFEYQKRHVKLMQTRRGLILGYATGNGKTLVSVTASQMLKDLYPGLQIHVVCTLSLIDNFRGAMRKYGIIPFDPNYHFYTYEGFAKEAKQNIHMLRGHMLICDEAHHLRTAIYTNLYAKLKLLVGKLSGLEENRRTEQEHILVTRYDEIRRRLMMCARNDFSDPVTVLMRDYRYNLLNVAPRSLIVVQAAREARKVILMTATPVYNEPFDVVNLSSIVLGQGIMSRRKFKQLMGNPRLFNQHFHHMFVFRDVDPNDPDFPRVLQDTVKIPMSHDYYTKYREVEKEQNDLFSSPWAFYGGVRQGTLGLRPNPKVNWTVRKVTEGRKTLIFSAFITHGIKAVQAAMEDMHIQYLEITGATKTEDRTQAVVEFNEDPNMNVLFVSAAGGEGLDLKGCRTVILLESEWNLPQEEQVIGRGPRRRSHVHLPLNEQEVHIYRLILIKPEKRARDPDDNIERSADEILGDIIVRKQRVIIPFMHQLKGCASA